MQAFSWMPLRSRRPHFSSPRFTELIQTASQGAGESPLIEVAPFDRAVLSWNGEGRWRLEMRVKVGDVLSPYFVMGVVDGVRQRSASDTDTPPAETLPLTTVLPAAITQEIDTLMVKAGTKATGFQVRATGEGNLRALAVAHYRRDDRRFTDRPAKRETWGMTLAVPERAQRDIKQDDGLTADEQGIGGDVCSPTSLSMVLEYYGSRYRTIEVARAAFDSESRLYGNWPCNTAAAARLLARGGWAAVVKMTGFDEVEREIAARRPVVLSHRWERGDLTNAPISHSNGHLIVAVGFTKDGDVVVNDPAAKAGEVRRTYRRRELFRTWQERGEGIAYLVHPF